MTDHRFQRILVVDDDAQFRRSLRLILSSANWVVIEARDAEEALEEIRADCPDLVLLDLKLPGMDGFECCKEMRNVSNVPIIALSVFEAEQQKVLALDSGADDYIAKPFSVRELLARIRAALRKRFEPEAREAIQTPGLNIDFERRQVIRNGQKVHLTPTEFALLKELVCNHGRPVPHLVLLKSLRSHSNTLGQLRVFISHLRNKIEQHPEQPRYIHTEPRVGYRFSLQ